jgi:hypothetical protein
MDMKTHMVLKFNPINFYEILQALGRGARMINKKSEGIIILSRL